MNNVVTTSLFGVKERDVAPWYSVDGGAIGRRIDPLWVDPLSYFSFQPVIHNWGNKVVMSAILSVE